jgi:hypothetical protein
MMKAALRRELSIRPLPACIKRFVMVCVYSDPMDTTSQGLTDKLFWRRVRGEWHCFQKLAQIRGYISLCRRREISFVQGQQIARPEARLRCSLCDGGSWRGAGGRAQARRRHDVRGASVDDHECQCSPIPALWLTVSQRNQG